MASKTRKLKSSEFILLVLHADNRMPINGNTRIQKIMFVFEKELYKQGDFHKLSDEPNLFKFSAYKFGPFSKEITKHLDFFVKYGMIDRELVKEVDEDLLIENSLEESDDSIDQNASQFGCYRYSITDIGAEFVETKILPMLSVSQWESILKLKKQFTAFGLKKVLNYVYTKYPDMTVNSEILEDVINGQTY
ncbi:MAG: hypothetical protein AB7E49_09970 [Campylobacterales bacterium]